MFVETSKTPSPEEKVQIQTEISLSDVENKKVSEDEHAYFEGYSRIYDMTHEIVCMRNKGDLNDESYNKLMEHASLLHKNGRSQYQKKIGDDGMRKMEKFAREKFFADIEKRFAEAEDVDSIIDTVNRLEGGIQGSQQHYDNKTLKEILTRVQNGSLGIDYVTNTYGLRDAMARVLEKQKNKNQSLENKETAEKLLQQDAKREGATVENQEMEADAKSDLVDFVEFATENESELDKLSGNDDEIEDYIYNNFYSNGQEKQYKNGDSNTENTRIVYNDSIVNLRKEIGVEIPIAKLGYWTSCAIGESLKNAKDIGRIYVNIKPDEVANFFGEAARLFSRMNLNIEMKVPSEFDQEKSEEILNRYDKMVIYFGTENEEKILDIINYLYDKYKNAFMKGKPRFSAKLKDSKGNPMEGIGFAEEPAFTRYRNESFGSIRSAILCEIIGMAKAEGKSIKDFNFEDAFKQICSKYRVNSAHPAFNSLSKRLKQNSPIYQRL